jgi:hypothetical protein
MCIRDTHDTPRRAITRRRDCGRIPKSYATSLARNAGAPHTRSATSQNRACGVHTGLEPQKIRKHRLTASPTPRNVFGQPGTMGDLGNGVVVEGLLDPIAKPRVAAS